MVGDANRPCFYLRQCALSFACESDAIRVGSARSLLNNNPKERCPVIPPDDRHLFDRSMATTLCKSARPPGARGASIPESERYCSGELFNRTVQEHQHQ